MGSVTTPGGASTANAAVRLTRDGDEDGAVVVRCGDGGAFRAEGLAPGRWRVVVAGGGFATRLDVKGTEARFVDLQAGDEVRVDLEASPLAVVAGRVTDADGRPVVGADVTIQCDAFLSTSGVWDLKTKSGDDGRFERANVTPGDSVQVEVVAKDAPRWTTWLRSVAPGGRTEVDVRLARGVRFELRLVDGTDASDARPVTGAIVWIKDAETQDLLEENGMRTDADGRVTLGVPEGRAVSLEIGADGHVSIPRRMVDADAVRAGPVTIRMERSLSISGRVTYADGRPAAGVQLTAYPPDDPTHGIGSILDRRATVGADGAYRIDGLRAGRFVVAVLGDGWDTIQVVPADAGANDVSIRLAAGAKPLRKIRVRIVGTGGVEIHEVRERDGVHQQGDVLSCGGGVLSSPEHSISFAPSTDTTAYLEAWDARDTAGRRLPLGHVFLEIPSDVPDPWTVELPAERFVEGRIVGPDGKGVAGAEIHVSSSASGRAIGEVARGSSDATGAFRMGGFGDAEYVLTATATGCVAASVVAHGGATDAVIRMDAGRRVNVRVVDTEGRPVEGAYVYVHPSDAGDDDDDDGFGLGDDHDDRATDADGRVVLPGLPAGVPHDLRVLVSVMGHEDGWFPGDLARWIPADVEIRIERQMRVEGVVRLPDGRAFPGCVVTAERDAAANARVENGTAPGAFSVRELHAGAAVRLRAAAGDVASPVVTVEPGRRDVVLVVDPGAWLAFQTESSEEDPFIRIARGGRLAVRLFPGGRSFHLNSTGPTAVGGLDARAVYTVLVGPDALGRCAEIRDVRADGRTVTLTLRPGLPVAGTATRGAGVLVDPRTDRVDALRDGVVVATTPLADDGAFRFPGLPAGRWTLRAMTASDASAIGTVEADAGEENVTIPPAGR